MRKVCWITTKNGRIEIYESQDNENMCTENREEGKTDEMRAIAGKSREKPRKDQTNN